MRVADPHRPTIVFLHESFGCIEHWKDFPYRLGEAANCNVMIYDRQGYGQSDPFFEHERQPDYLEIEAEALNQLLLKLDLKEVILYGHSDGGSIALLAAAKYPEKITAVFTEGAHVFVEDVTLEGINRAVEAYATSDLKDKLSKYHKEKTDAVFNMWADTWLSEDFLDWNIESFLPQITCPVFVMQGAKDEYATEAQLDAIADKAGGNTCKLIISEAGHSPHRDKEKMVIAVVSKFIGTMM
jgi:pimeloyl-ACP methyl ester carboxylesterase